MELGEGVYREWKGRRGASICTEVERSWNPGEESSSEWEWEGESGRWMRSNTSRSANSAQPVEKVRI